MNTTSRDAATTAGASASPSLSRTPETPMATHESARTPALGDALDTTRRELSSAQAGRLAYYADESGEGRPLVLIHSINAAPSSFEVKPLFEHYRGRRPVYSLDLPGFGHSERPAHGYSPERFADALTDFLGQVVQSPADVLALSLSAEFAARAAQRAPEHFASLALISPTGFSSRSVPHRRIGRIAHRVLTLPLLSQALYDLVASKPSIRYYLGKSFIDQPPEAMIDYAHATSHQPGARHAPLTFLSSLLFTPKALERLYAPLTELPVLVIADLDPYVTFERLAEFVAAHPNWQTQTFAPHRGLPHWERPTETVDALDRFWKASSDRAPA